MNPATAHMKDSESALLYFGARYYDAELTTMWLSVDPMADKYPSMSPYAYCAWNPVKYVDPSGETIWIVGDDGVPVKYLHGEKYMGTDIFVKQTFEAINSIHEDDPDNSGLKLSKLEDNTLNSDIYVIKTQEESNYFNLLSSASSENYLKAIIEFNPELGLYSQISNKTTAKVMSPSSALFHEFGHAYDYFIKDENGKTYVDRHNNENNIYKNDEEKYNIINNEYVLAKKRNELIRGSYNNGVRAAIIDISTDNGGMRSTKVKKKLSAYKR